jgi:protein TonB
MSEVEVKPHIRSKPNPGYTEEARRNGVSGRVVVSAVLCRTGEVGDVEVIEGLPHGLSEEAIKAARRIKFEPGRKDDERVNVRVRVIYNFELY